MDGLEWRAPTDVDLPAWVELLAAIEAADRAGEVIGTRELEDQIGLSYFDPITDARLGWTVVGELVAWGTVLCIPNARQRRVSLQGAVHPEWRGRGVGSELVAWQVARGLDVGAAGPPELPGWLEVVASEHDRARADVFRDCGFAPIRYYLEMRRDLSAPIPEPRPAVGVTLEPFDVPSDELVRLAHNEAFEDHWGATAIDEETWATWCTGHHEFRADRSFVARDGHEVVGYALNSEHPNDWPALGFREGWTHQLGVLRPWRRRGVATALLLATLRAFVGDGLDFAALDVDSENPTGALALYESVGYARERCYVAWAHPLS